MEIRINVKAALLLIAFIVPTIILSAYNHNDPIRGYEIVTEALEESEEDYQLLWAYCPEDKVAIGGGAGIYFNEDGDYEDVPVLISSFMYPDNTGWYAEARQPEDADTEWHLEVQVICAYVED
jgi:hypothetical protein